MPAVKADVKSSSRLGSRAAPGTAACMLTHVIALSQRRHVVSVRQQPA